jgi:secretion/DNA translocation related TadE-like protein
MPAGNRRRAQRAQFRSQRGSVTILAAAMLLVLGVLALGLADVGRVLAERERAQTAADAAALAAADQLALPSDETAAEAAAVEAAENGAHLVDCLCDPGTTQVDVEVSITVEGLRLYPGDHVVRAWARAVVSTGGGTSDLPSASPGL